MPEQPRLSRRSFLKFIERVLGALGLAALVGPAVAFFWPSKLEEMPSEPVPVGAADSIPPGQSKTVRFGRYPALVIHTEEGLRAYSAVCTHFACIVKWDPARAEIVCPCHEGFFRATDGSVISGPPPRPLEAIPHLIEDGTLYIGGEA